MNLSRETKVERVRPNDTGERRHGPPPQNSFYGEYLTRLETLTDGVFAIVMTILVFGIQVPKNHDRDDLLKHLVDLWPEFLAYGISFAVLGIYWIGHHATFRFIRRINPELLWLNLCFLAFLSLIPFSARILASDHNSPVALVWYGGNLIAVGFAMLAIWEHATRRHRLVDAETPKGVIAYARSRIYVGLGAYSISILVAFFAPTISLLIYALVPSVYILPPIHRRWLRLYGLSVGDLTR